MERSKQKRIYEAILARVEEGFWSPGSRILSERQLATLYSVSRLTVKHAITQLVSEGILEYRPGRQGTFVVQGYRPGMDHPALSARAARTILIAIDNHSPAFASSLLQGIHDSLWNRGYQSLYCNTNQQCAQLLDQMKSMLAAGVSGIIFSPLLGENNVKCNEDILRFIRKSELPVVLVDRYLDGESLSHVVINNREAMGQLTERLLAAGHRRFLVMRGFEATSTRDRMAGILDACAEWGLGKDSLAEVSVDEEAFAARGVLPESCLECVSALKGVTALIGLNPILLKAGLKLTRDLHIRVTSASIAASEMEVMSDIAVIQPLYQVGFEAGNLIVRQAEDPNAPVSHLILKASFSAQSAELPSDAKRMD